MEEKRGEGRRAGETPCTENKLIIIIIFILNNNNKSIAFAANINKNKDMTGILGLARETVAGTYFILLSSEHRPAAMPAIILQFVFVLLYFNDVFVCLCFPVKHREPRAQCVQVCGSVSSKGIAGVHTRLCRCFKLT